MTRLALLPVLIVSVCYALVSPTPLLSAVAALILLATIVVPTRVTAALPAQVMLGFAVFGVTMLVLTTVASGGPTVTTQLRVAWNAFGGAMLLVTAQRFWIDKPAGRDAITLGLGLIALTACGGALTSGLYPAAVGLYLASAFAARRHADAGRAPLSEVLHRQTLPMALMLLVTGGVAFAIVSALPSAHEWAIARFRMYAMARSGFSERMWLGSMYGMLMSDRKVMRVRGEADHLRGIVYTHYANGRWSAEDEDQMRPVTLERDALQGNAVEIEIIDPEPRRYFLPLQAGRIRASSGVARVDPLGVVAPIAAEPSDRMWFDQPSADNPRQYSVQPPSAADLELPRHIARAIRPLALEWTEGLVDDADKLRALEKALQTKYGYSLEFREGRRSDPILDFLLDQRAAHCEYFATAMALLARTISIPARVAGGYRVHEKNELGGYYVVRERNAHAWVEAWVEGAGWRTYDPTPPGELIASMESTTPFASALVDVIGSGWAAFLSWLDRRSWTEMIVTPSVLILFAFGYRWWRSRRTRLSGGVAELEAALPCFDKLSAALAKRGVVRAAAETPLQLAARVGEALDDEVAGRVVGALERYAALRYGDRGDERGLIREIDAVCGELR